LVEALVTRKAVVSGETVVMIYNRTEVGLLLILLQLKSDVKLCDMFAYV